MRNYYWRIAFTSFSLALALAIIVWIGPRASGVRVVAQGPLGNDVPAGSLIQLTFDRPVDRRSVEERFALTPALPGRIAWQAQTMTFRPDGLLRSSTHYTVTLEAGLRGERGQMSSAPISWSFRTRAPQIVYLEGRPGSGSHIALVQPGNEPRILAEADQMSAIVAAPSGDRLVYVVQRDPQRQAIWLLDIGGDVPRPLVDDPTASASSPAWAPDGSLIAYERRTIITATGSLGPPRLWLAQPDGTALGPVGDNETVTFAPAWSPDGRYLAFADGTNQQQIVFDAVSKRTAFAQSAGEAAAWSLASGTFVYTGFRAPNDPTPVLRRAVVGGEAETIPDTEGAGSPAWSPDGQWIAFTRRGSGEQGNAIWLMPAAGGTPRQLTQPGPSQDLLPVWIPDSQSLGFTRISPTANGVTSTIWQVTLDGAEQPLVEQAFAPLWLP